MADHPKTKTVAVRGVPWEYSAIFNRIVDVSWDEEIETKQEARLRIFKEMVEAKVREELGENGMEFMYRRI